ncbi:hypothetical protein BJX63DRAFT_306649 [Aspergillus granulosus]|uniref:DUF7820 domain-containing protein n=1 Tax=Aspergillus granulosus TaxID=176169 RepID=A0ABR4H5H4_9EURO
MSGRLSSDHSRSLSRSSQSRSGPAHDPDSMRHPSTPGRSSNPNVFSDEYSLEPLDSEQSTLTPRSLSISSNASSHTLRSSLPHHQKQTSVNEDDLLENPFRDEARVSFDDESPHRSSLPQKGVELSYRNSVTSNTSTLSTAQRSQSTSSSRFSIPPRALSPYTGATGPSHPYAMYPQVGVSRSNSVATTSTIRPVDAPLMESTGPQHPYAMYSQNVVEEDLEDSSIPLGFPVHGQESYHRPPNRAADDVGDLIGPDGYTEQLPPYSRYPEGASPKLEASVDGLPVAVVALDQPNSNERDAATSDTSSRTLVAGNQPVYGANSTANELTVTDNQPVYGANRTPNEPPVTGVMAFEEKLKRKGKKRVCCGLPVWTLVLISVVMIVGGSIGGAIGGILGAKKAAEASAEDDEPTTTTITVPPRTDATPYPGTPYNVPPIPTGQWTIPAVPKNQSKFCILDQDQTPTWGCLSQKAIPITIEGDKDDRKIDFGSNQLPKTLTYGAQAPFFTNPSINLSLVMDTSDLSLGPALSFFTFFDKLIVVPEDTLTSSDIASRSVPEEQITGTYSKRASDVGERPWFCWWNSTVMEFFLYINQTTKVTRYDTSSSLANSDSTDDDNDDNKALTTDSLSKRGDDSSDYYPRRIKIEEKRDYAEAQAPYCQQMQVMGDGSIQTISPATIGISVNEPTPATTVSGTGSATETYTAMAQYQSICYCVSLTD